MATQFTGFNFRGNSRQRTAALIAATSVQLLLGFALLHGLPNGGSATLARALEAFAIPVPPPPKPLPPPVVMPKPAHHAAAPPAPHPRALHPALAAAAPVTTAPSPVVAAVDIPDLGVAAVGGGGGGVGSGAGGNGNGSGDGGGSPAEWLRGRITPDDFPNSVYRHGARFQLASRFIIGTDGRVESCSVTESSGNPDIDATTCRLIVERYRFRPARDPAGNAIREEQSRHHYWGMRPPPGDG